MRREAARRARRRERTIRLEAVAPLRGDGDAPIPVFVKLSQYGGEDSLFPLIRVGLNRHGQINLSPDDNDAATQSLLEKRMTRRELKTLCGAVRKISDQIPV